jgi:hypothetical protein
MNVNGVLTRSDGDARPRRLHLELPSLGRSVVAADFDGDGWGRRRHRQHRFPTRALLPELGVESGGVWQGLAFETGRVPVFTPGGRFCSMAHGDIDNDGDSDLFLGDYDNTLEDRLLVNDGTGHFTDATNTRLPTAPLRPSPSKWRSST